MRFFHDCNPKHILVRVPKKNSLAYVARNHLKCFELSIWWHINVASCTLQIFYV